MDLNFILNSPDPYPTGLERYSIEQLEILERTRREEIFWLQDRPKWINNRLSDQQTASPELRGGEIEAPVPRYHDGVHEVPTLQNSLLNSPPPWEYPITGMAAVPFFGSNSRLSGGRETTTQTASPELVSTLPPPSSYVPPSLGRETILGGNPSTGVRYSSSTGLQNTYAYRPRLPLPSSASSSDHTYDLATPELVQDDSPPGDHTAGSRTGLPPLRSVIPEIDLNPPPPQGHEASMSVVAHPRPQYTGNHRNSTRFWPDDQRNTDTEDVTLPIPDSVALEITITLRL